MVNIYKLAKKRYSKWKKTKLYKVGQLRCRFYFDSLISRNVEERFDLYGGREGLSILLVVVQ